MTQNFSCEISLLISVYVIRIFNLYNRLSSCSTPEVNDLKPKINFNVHFRRNVVQYQKKCRFFQRLPQSSLACASDKSGSNPNNNSDI